MAPRASSRLKKCEHLTYLLQFPGVVGLRPFGTVESVAGMPGNLVPRSWSLNERYA